MQLARAHGAMAAAVLLLLAVAVAAKTAASGAPEQVHIALGYTPDCVRVNWVTHDNAAPGAMLVQWGTSASSLTYAAADEVFPFKVDKGRTWCTHVAEMSRLQPETVYYFRVGSDAAGFSDVYSFRSAPVVGQPSVPQLYLAFGDLGAGHAYSLCIDCGTTDHCTCSNTNAGIISEIGKANVAIHVGDIAYNLDNNNGVVGDYFMMNMQPVATAMPYMVCHGNHEHGQNFAHYTERFRHMPSNSGNVTSDNGEAPNNWWYSWNHGLVHYVVLSTEVYYDYLDLVPTQFNWLQQDLSSIDRRVTPWLIVIGHRPLYCTADAACTKDAGTVRDGQYGLEQLFHKFGVDLYLCGHVHNYERFYDTYQSQSAQTTYNPKATTYVTTGAAGCPEKHQPFVQPQPPYSAFRANTYGYSRYTVYNATHLHWQQVQTQKDTQQDIDNYGTVLDDMWLVQESHGSFSARRRDWARTARFTGDPKRSRTVDVITGHSFTADQVPSHGYFRSVESTMYKQHKRTAKP